jgi:chromosome segregation ATPase
MQDYHADWGKKMDDAAKAIEEEEKAAEARDKARRSGERIAQVAAMFAADAITAAAESLRREPRPPLVDEAFRLAREADRILEIREGCEKSGEAVFTAEQAGSWPKEADDALAQATREVEALRAKLAAAEATADAFETANRISAGKARAADQRLEELRVWHNAKTVEYDRAMNALDEKLDARDATIKLLEAADARTHESRKGEAEMLYEAREALRKANLERAALARSRDEEKERADRAEDALADALEDMDAAIDAENAAIDAEIATNEKYVLCRKERDHALARADLAEYHDAKRRGLVDALEEDAAIDAETEDELAVGERDESPRDRLRRADWLEWNRRGPTCSLRETDESGA